MESDFCAPVLLEQLLRSMENFDTRYSAAVSYAVLSLLARLMATQSSVFNLWFSRRCYERSRGEMITMLSEKILSRKYIASTTEPHEVVNPNSMKEGRASMKTKDLKLWKGLYGAITGLCSVENEGLFASKKPASSTYSFSLPR